MGKPWENGEKHGNMVIFTKENADWMGLIADFNDSEVCKL